MPQEAPPDMTSNEAKATETEGQEGSTNGDQKQQQQDPPGDEAKPTETVDYWKQRSRENERKAKENADAAKRLADIEDKDKSEQQKLSEKVAAAEKRAAEAEASVLRRDIAATKGLPAGMADRLRGTTQDEIEEDADALLKTLKDAGGGPKAVDLKQGDRGGDAGGNDVDAWIRKAAGRSN